MSPASEFSTQIDSLHLLKHPFYQDWMLGTLSRSTLQDYVQQYAAHVRAFPRYISAIHSQCENELARQILLENLNDEEGLQHGTSHPELWLRFAEGLGLSRVDLQSAPLRLGIQKVISTFFTYARSSFHEGLGALYAYESQVPEIAESKIAGLKAHYQVQDPRALEFFQVHQTADVYHREAIEKLLTSLPEKEKQESLQAAKAAAQSLWDFLTDVHQYHKNQQTGSYATLH